MLRADPKVSARAMAEDLVTDMRPALPALKMPVTVLHPATTFRRDAAETAAFYRQQFAGTPRLELVAVPDARHFIMLDQPQRFASELERFLR